MHAWHGFPFGRGFPQWRFGMVGHRGGGRHGLGWMGDRDGMGGDGFARGRKFGADDLQLMLLSLLQEQPRHGYELIKELEARSNGFYTPSPGVVYPALTYLEELDYATVEIHGNRKRYHVTEIGRGHLAAHQERVELLFAALGHAARKMAWMKQAWRGAGGQEDADAQAEEESGWLREFVDARRALKAALLRHSAATPDAQRRIAAILRRAAAEIEAGQPSPAPGEGRGRDEARDETRDEARSRDQGKAERE